MLTLTEPEVITVIKRLAKQRTDAIEQFTKGDRPELAEKEAREKIIVEHFLPAMASREEIERIAQEKKLELGVTDNSGAGKLMGAVIKALEGNADSAVVKDVVNGLFS